MLCGKPKYSSHGLSEASCGDGSTKGSGFPSFICVSPPLHAEFLTQSKRRRYLLGISGGRDSVALLHLLLDAGFRNLVLCHLNHSLRGAESGKDAALVRRLAKKHGLACEIGRTDVPALMAKNGESMELAARNARHQFFADCARKHRCNRILIAHHADDQAETILFNLLRGSYGLKGMRFWAVHQVGSHELHFLRPLLEVPREEINGYLVANKVSYRDDASNAECSTTRNQLRNEAMPLLNQIMGREIRPAILRAAASSRQQQEAIANMLEALKLTDPQGRLFLPKLAVLSPALQSSAIHSYLKEHGIPDISHELLARCTSLIDDQSVAKLNLPGGRFLRRKEKRIFIS